MLIYSDILFIQILNSLQLCTATNARIQMVIHQWVDFKGVRKTSRLQEWTYCAWEAPYVALETGAPKAATLGIFGILWVTDFNEHQWTWMITYGVAWGCYPQSGESGSWHRWRNFSPAIFGKMGAQIWTQRWSHFFRLSPWRLCAI